MLVLSRKVGQSIRIGNATVTVTRVTGRTVRLGIDAPPETPIARTELGEPKNMERNAEVTRAE